MLSDEIRDLIAFVEEGHLRTLVTMHLVRSARFADTILPSHLLVQPQLPSAADAVALLRALQSHCPGIKTLTFEIVR
jgi:hypothetical protein